MTNRRKRDAELIQRVSKSLDLPDYQAGARLDIAKHESGHMVAAIILNEEIIGIGLHGKGSLSSGSSWTRPRGRDVIGLRGHMVVLWSGVLAEGRELPADGSGEIGDDHNKLRELAREIVGAAGSEKRIDAEIRRARSRAEKLVKRHRPEIELLAAKLCELYCILDGIKP
jgi:hypothetical protein